MALRIGILTYHFSDNFGAGLQAYALREWLQRNGAEAEFVNYHPSHVEAGGRLRLPVSAAALKANAKVVFLWASQLRDSLFSDPRRRALFDQFRQDTLGVQGPRLPDPEAVDSYLSSPEGRFDILVCGSDQIWAPNAQVGLDPVYFLSFPGGANGALRASYAPSFGRASLESEFRASAAEMLRGFDALSARELSGVETVSALTGQSVAWVPDPTILLGDFQSFVKRHSEKVGDNHVFCYALRTAQGIREAASLASEIHGAPIRSPHNPHRRWREIGQTIYPSPDEWVAQLAHARCVVTNSFHGTVFSILFRKPFVTVALPGSRAALNERSRNLLETVGLEDRLVDGENPQQLREALEREIDWEGATEKLATLQKQGRDYIAAEVLRHQ